MFRLRSKLVQAAIALVLLATSAALWPSLGTSAIYAAGCDKSHNFVCITPIPTDTLTLNGTNQTISYTLDFSLSVRTDTWNVTISSTQFKTGGSPAHTLLATASSVMDVCQQGSPCTPFPHNTVQYPFTMTAGDGSTPELCNATANGSGTFNATAMIHVAVPGSAYVGTYTSMITLTLVTGSP